MATEDQYFYEDEVYRINKKGYVEFGMVVENSELASSDEDTVSGEGSGRIKRGHIRVAWHPTGAEEVVSERKVGLADRSLMPGDVVRRMIKGKDTQRGYCRHMDVIACVQVVGSKHIIKNVNSMLLSPIEVPRVTFPSRLEHFCLITRNVQKLSPDLAVCLDSWVGGIKSVHSKLHLRLPDGSKCIVRDPEHTDFENSFDEKKEPDSEFPHRGDYYPGQNLWGPVQLLLNLGEWSEQTSKDYYTKVTKNKSKTIKVVVEDVEIDSVSVQWQCRAYSKDGAGSEKEQPKVLITGDDIKRLKMLSIFEPCTLQVGDRHFYVIRAGDQIVAKDQWRQEQTRLIVNISKNFPPVKVKHKKLESSGKQDDNKKNESENCETQDNVDVEPLENHNNLPADAVAQSSEYESETETASNASSSASAVSNSGSKRMPCLPVRTLTKVLHKKKLRRAPQRKKPAPVVALEPGQRVIVETASTNSTADVVWQDGSVELGIPSTELYPIHHLDDQEFFPGDFVIENREDACMRVYGVIQKVDHAGRMASVKWFKTYTSSETPKPSLVVENDMSVYDLKDHPDFQYRPGTVVIRVANFQGQDESCTAGQVLDNYPEGRVKVWWIEGHKSMCWPQDLYKVGEYDSDTGELWDDNSSEDGSWQTESEDSDDEANITEDVYNENLKPKLAANIEKARKAMSRLEEIFTQNPSLQTPEVMRKLLEVYKDCRYLDKLMGTSFFHEMHFKGLLERVRERGRTNLAQRVADQVSRLFSISDSSEEKGAIGAGNEDEGLIENKRPSGQWRDSNGEFLTKGNLAVLEKRISSYHLLLSDVDATTTNGSEERTIEDVGSGGRKSEAVVMTTTTMASSTDQTINCTSSSSSNVCLRLCSLIHAQLVKAHSEVIRRFGGHNGVITEESAGESVEDATPNDSASTTEMNGVSITNDAVESSTDIVATMNEANGLGLRGVEIKSIEVNSNDVIPKPSEKGVFTVMDTAPTSHKFRLTMFQPTDPKTFFRRVREEIKLLKTSLPSGIWVTAFEDRMDLFSVMIKGPEKTPYEDGLFFFDFQLTPDYPKTAPHCHYISYCSDRLNPNLYEDGKVCVSLLGTWTGKGTEVWTSTSNLLQVIVSIQGLILVAEPYFNEAGYEKQKGSQQGRENSRMYNEMVVLKLVQAMTKLILGPPPVFKNEIMAHFTEHAQRLSQRLNSWLDLSENYNTNNPLSPSTPSTYDQFLKEVEGIQGVSLPEYPLIPASKGFCLTLRKTLVTFKQVMDDQKLKESLSSDLDETVTPSS